MDREEAIARAAWAMAVYSDLEEADMIDLGPTADEILMAFLGRDLEGLDDPYFDLAREVARRARENVAPAHQADAARAFDGPEGRLHRQVLDRRRRLYLA